MDVENRKLELEDKILRYFQNKEIAKERTEENKLLWEEIEALCEDSEQEEYVLQLPNGEYAILGKKAYIKDVLDKDALAQELLVAKDELKTPFDWSFMTSRGRLTPDMISKHTQTETVVKTKLAKRKSKPRKKATVENQTPRLHNFADHPHEVGDVVDTEHGKGTVTKVGTKTQNADGSFTLTPSVVGFNRGEQE